MSVQGSARQTVTDAIRDYAEDGGSSYVMARYLMMAAVEAVVRGEFGKATIEVTLMTKNGSTHLLTDSADPVGDASLDGVCSDVGGIIEKAWTDQITDQEALIQIDDLLVAKKRERRAGTLDGVALGLAAG